MVVIIFWCSTMQFLSTLSLRRATTAIHVIQGGVDISIHALLAESDPPRHWHGGKPGHFYPRSPCGERQCARGPLRGKAPFLSTLSLRRATTTRHISPPTQSHFYPRSPCGERPHVIILGCKIAKFLSTLSLRRATPGCGCTRTWYRHFYPRSPCGERRVSNRLFIDTLIFLSTLSLRRATLCVGYFLVSTGISIHALLAESDRAQVRCWQLDRYFYPRSPCGERRKSKMPMRQPAYFYPRSPCGERPLTTCKYACKPEFLSTLSLRRATSPHRPAPASVRISIHALLAESDRARRYKVH